MGKLTLIQDNIKPRNLLEALQSVVIRRYSRVHHAVEPVVFEFTQDRAYIHQYHVLLDTTYRRMYSDASQFKAEIDLYDKLSYILIARRGNLVLGGCRLTVREYDEMWDLPLECPQFKLRSVFPELQLDRERHGEISRFAVMEDTGSVDIFQGMCKVMYEKVCGLKIHYLFAKSTYPLARNWRLIANSLGAKTTRICKDIEVPEHPHIKNEEWYVTLSDLSTVHGAEEVKMPVEQAMRRAETFESLERPYLALID